MPTNRKRKRDKPQTVAVDNGASVTGDEDYLPQRLRKKQNTARVRSKNTRWTEGMDEELLKASLARRATGLLPSGGFRKRSLEEIAAHLSMRTDCRGALNHGNVRRRLQKVLSPLFFVLSIAGVDVVGLVSKATPSYP